MMHGVTALLERSLRTDARSWQMYFVRFALAIGIYFCLMNVVMTSQFFGAPGLRFFSSIMWANIIVGTLLGVGFFSTSITEEKEEDTLGLMQMAGINSLGILLGKLGGRLAQALLLVAVQYPFTLFATTMGGILSHQILCAFVGLAAYLILISGIGTLCSTVARQNRTASALTTIAIISYALIPLIARYLIPVLPRLGINNSNVVTILDFIRASSLFLTASDMLATGFDESIMSVQVVSNAFIGIGCYFLTWSLFGVCTYNQAADPAPARILSRVRRDWMLFYVGRPTRNPFSWKDFHFIGGGVGKFTLRLLFFGGGATLWIWVNLLFPNAAVSFDVTLLQLIMAFVITADIAQAMSRAVHEEIRGQNLQVLMILPTPTLSILLSKIGGVLIATLPGPLSLCVITYCFDYSNVRSLLNDPEGWYVLSHFVLIPHLAIVLATFVRWGFSTIAFAITFGLLFGWLITLQVFSGTFNNPRNELRVIAVITLIACGLSYLFVSYRLKQLAARG